MSDTRRSRFALISAAIAMMAMVGLTACSGGAGALSSSPSSRNPRLPTPSSLASSNPATSPNPTPGGMLTPSASATKVGTPGVFVFPVVGNYSYAHVHHDYPATDIITACGNTVRAVTSGVILEVTRVDRWTASVNAGATRGGLSVSIKGDDGVRYYGSHFESINKNIQPGVRVTVGEPLGKVGRTGDASACHLHFGISPVCRGTGDWWIQRGVIWPWPYLDSWRKGSDKSPVAEIASWQRQHGCPSKPLVDP